MFERLHPPDDGDIVAAARRRLAALSLQHTPGLGSGVDEPARSDDQVASFSDLPRVESGLSPGGVPESVPEARRPARPARHVGEKAGQRGRLTVRSQHITVVALGVVLLVVLVAWWSMRSVPHAQQVDVSGSRELPGGTVVDVAAPASVPPSPALGVASGDARGGARGGATVGSVTASSTRLVVDVAGKVRQPGIVELPPGSRVIDAITAAGGARPGVSLTSLNLASLLVDGQQVVVGLQVPVLVGAPPASGTGPSGPATASVAPVELNTATPDQLEALPGIGPVTAQAILQWRADNGPFTSVDELLEVSGIGDATLSDLRPYVYV